MVGRIGSPGIGILALQGDVSLHARALRRLGVEPRLVKVPAELRGLRGLIMPGGESTALLRLMEPAGLLQAVARFAANGGQVFGSCAGAILAADKVVNPVQTSLKLINVTIERNAYGRQIDSSEATGRMRPPFGSGKLAMTFIRAPRIVALGKGVKVLATYNNEPVMAQQNNILISTFHPELDGGSAVYDYWLKRIA